MSLKKNLALGGVMLAAVVPTQASFVYAQTVSPTPAASTASTRPLDARTRALLAKASASAKVYSASPNSAGVLLASNTPAKPAATKPVALVPIASNLPAPVVRPAPAPAPTVVETIVETVTDVVGAAVDAVTKAVDAVIEAVSPPPAPVAVVPAPSAPVATDPASPPATTDAASMATASLAGVPVAKVFVVSNLTELRSALAAAQSLAGAEIRVNPGNYGLLDWQRKTYELGRVFVVAATSEKPVFLGIAANGSTNMSFHGLKVAGGTGKLVQLNGAENMTFTGGEISGLNEDGDPWGDGATAIQVRFSKNVAVQDTKFSDVRAAMYVQRSSNVSIRYNRVSHLREGYNIVATDMVTVQGNHFSNFYPQYHFKEHPDAIQLWTNGETVGSTRVRIKENLISMGGKRAIQGVLAGCEAAGVRHKDWELTRNVYYGSSVHGLSFSCVDGLKVWNNVIVASPHADVNNSIRSADGKESGGYLPRLRVRLSTGVVAWNNVLMAGPSTDAAINKYDNWDLVDAMGWGGLPWTDLFAGGRPTEESPPLSAFITKNPSLARTGNAGVITPFTLGMRSLSRNEALTDALGRLTAN